jgi:phage-related protein
MVRERPIAVQFFRLDSGREPVREWLKGMRRELRSNLGPGIARTFFTIYETKIVLLHGFIKKSQKTPANELALAKRRLNKLRS